VARLNQALHDSMTGLVSGANPSTPGLAGVSVDSKGAYVFDKSKFLAAYANDPDGTMRVFAQSGSTSSSSLAFGSATDFTPPGTYSINVTRAATQASSTSSGLPAVGTTIRARVGSTIAAYTVQAGDTTTTVAAGLNSAFAGQNLGLLASVSGGNLTIATGTYGSRSTVDVAWDGSTYTTNTGVDVAGTINGVTAVGTGQALAAPASDATVAGLVVTVFGSTTGALGTVTYTPGAAARTSRAVTQATDTLNGYITSSENAIKSTKTLIDDQVTRLTTSLTAYTARLKQQFAQLETAMSDAKQQGNWLSAQLG
jgi:flagellar hook-associated protein 2